MILSGFAPGLSILFTATIIGTPAAFACLTIDEAFLPDAEPGTRGARTLSEIRRIRGIAASFTPEEGGAIELVFDVREAFRGCDFGALGANPKDSDGAVRLVQGKATGNDQVVTSLFQGLKSATGTWTVRFVSP